MQKPSTFIIRTVIVGVLVAIALLYLLPEDFLGQRPVVELRQSKGHDTHLQYQGPVSYAEAVKRAAPSVVNIYTSKTSTRRRHPLLDDPLFKEFFGERFATPRKRTQTSLGSGVILSPQGYVLTNNHVIQDADEISIMLADSRNVEAHIVGGDPETDLAVLKIAPSNLPSITVGKSDQLQVGDVVLAIGNPFGVGKTVTQGIVSATGRNRLGINTIEDFIQTDAAINPGNSGGALINAYGELVGINTAIFSQSGGSHGIGFAIPVTLAQDILTQIIEGGRVIRGWLGVEVQDVSLELAESFGLDQTQGVLIAGVVRNGPAGEAGIEPGDILLSLNDLVIDNARDALDVISRQEPGGHVRVHGIRRGRNFETEILVGRRPPMR